MPSREVNRAAHLQSAGQSHFGLSKFRFYSVGRVAANMPLDSDLIEVTPTEDFPFMEGELTDHSEKQTVKGQREDGSAFSVSVQQSNTIQAKWLRNHDNRLTPPNVRRGETVILYQFGDADKYYWTTQLIDSKLRRLETVIYGWSASAVEDDPVDSDHMYYFELSTHKKLVTFHTSKVNGEFTAYDIQINTQDGTILIQDDMGNYISLDSRAVRMELKNADGVHYDMDRKNLTVTVPETTTMISKNMNFLVDQALSIRAGNSMSVATKALSHVAQTSSLSATSVTQTASGSMNVNAGASLTLNASGPATLSSSASATVMSPATALI